MRCVVALAATLAALCTSVSAQAQNSVGLSPTLVGADAGEVVEVDLVLDFADPALGGGLVVSFDPAHLAFDSFSFDAGFMDDPALRLVCPSAAPACASYTGMGVLVAFAVDTISFPPISGAQIVGRLRFDVLTTTSSVLGTGEDDSVAGPIVGVGAFDPPSFGSADVVPTADLPPAAPALGAPALLALGVGLALVARGYLRGEAPRVGTHPGGRTA